MDGLFISACVKGELLGNCPPAVGEPPGVPGLNTTASGCTRLAAVEAMSLGIGARISYMFVKGLDVHEEA